MSIVFAALVSFIGLMLIVSHLGKTWFRRAVGYKWFIDLLLHGTIIYMFFGTSTLGLLQAEAAGIMFSIYLRAYAWLGGYEKLHRGRWVRYAGMFT